LYVGAVDPPVASDYTIAIYGCQIEASLVPTSYIPNPTSGTMTRAADSPVDWALSAVLKRILSSGGTGTISVDVTPGFATSQNTGGSFVSLSPSGTPLFMTAASDYFQASDGVNTASVAAGLTAGQTARLAVRFNSASNQLQVSKVVGGAITNSTVVPYRGYFGGSNPTDLLLGSGVNLPCHYKNLRIDPIVLSDAQLIALP
jgi:hypothetical protein